MSEGIQEIREPHDEEPPLGVSIETPGKIKENPPCPETSYAIASLEFSDWKLVRNKFSEATTVPRGSKGHKGTQQLSFGTLKLPVSNKDIQFSLEKSGKTEKNGQYLDKNK